MNFGDKVNDLCAKGISVPGKNEKICLPHFTFIPLLGLIYRTSIQMSSQGGT